MFLAGLLSGATGFGFGMLSTPLLLTSGFSLPFVVTANLTISILTRISIVYQLRAAVMVRRVAALIAGSIPGLYAGAWTLAVVDRALIQTATGLLIMATAIALLWMSRRPPPRAIPGAPLAAGIAGGFLGATTSLSGIPPALLLARDRAKPVSFLADLAVYFVVANSLGLCLLYLRGELVRDALLPASALWLPGALLGNFLGVQLGRRLPVQTFRALVLGLIFVSGLLAVVTVLRGA